MTSFLDRIETRKSDKIVSISETESLNERDVNLERTSTYTMVATVGCSFTAPDDLYHDRKKEVRRFIAREVYGEVDDRLMRWFYENRVEMKLTRQATNDFYEILKDMR